MVTRGWKKAWAACIVLWGGWECPKPGPYVLKLKWSVWKQHGSSANINLGRTGHRTSRPASCGAGELSEQPRWGDDDVTVSAAHSGSVNCQRLHWFSVEKVPKQLLSCSQRSHLNIAWAVASMSMSLNQCSLRTFRLIPSPDCTVKQVVIPPRNLLIMESPECSPPHAHRTLQLRLALNFRDPPESALSVGSHA